MFHSLLPFLEDRAPLSCCYGGEEAINGGVNLRFRLESLASQKFLEIVEEPEVAWSYQELSEVTRTIGGAASF